MYVFYQQVGKGQCKTLCDFISPVKVAEDGTGDNGGTSDHEDKYHFCRVAGWIFEIGSLLVQHSYPAL